jgi:hypothetical protein
MTLPAVFDVFPMMMNELFGEVTKSHNRCAAATESGIDEAIDLVDATIKEVEQSGNGASALSELNAELFRKRLSKSVTESTVRYHKAIKELAKVRLNGLFRYEVAVLSRSRQRIIHV